MSFGFRLWLAAAGLLVAAGVVVPYGVLGGGPPAFDILAFWGAFGVAVVGLVAAGLARWRG